MGGGAREGSGCSGVGLIPLIRCTKPQGKTAVAPTISTDAGKLEGYSLQQCQTMCTGMWARGDCDCFVYTEPTVVATRLIPSTCYFRKKCMPDRFAVASRSNVYLRVVENADNIPIVRHPQTDFSAITSPVSVSTQHWTVSDD